MTGKMTLNELKELLPAEVSWVQLVSDSAPTWLVWSYEGFRATIVKYAGEVFTVTYDKGCTLNKGNQK